MSDDRYRSRYAPQPISSDEDRAATWAEVNAVWQRFMPSRRGESIGGGGLILQSSNGSAVTAEHVNTDGPGMSIAWRQMVDKARKEIAEHSQHIETIERLEQMAAIESDSESTVIMKPNERDDFAAEWSQFERLTEQLENLIKQGTQ